MIIKFETFKPTFFINQTYTSPEFLPNVTYNMNCSYAWVDYHIDKILRVLVGNFFLRNRFYFVNL